MQLEKVNLH